MSLKNHIDNTWVKTFVQKCISLWLTLHSVIDYSLYVLWVNMMVVKLVAEYNLLSSQWASKPHWPQRRGWDVPPQRQPLLIQQAQLWSRTSLGQVQPEEVWVHKSSWSTKEERKREEFFISLAIAIYIKYKPNTSNSWLTSKTQWYLLGFIWIASHIVQ